MKLLEKIIAEEGRVYPGNILKVDSFLNHQIDVSLVDRLGEELYWKYKDKNITKILTIEASGIAVACSVARNFDVPVVFAKKSQSLNIGSDVYVSRISSFTYGKEYDVTVSTAYLDKSDIVLLVDDFIAVGNAMKGLVDICNQAGAGIAGIGICIEKAFQNGGDDLRKMGYEVTSLAIIESMTEDGQITFRKQEEIG
ncbi:xanthine phosphoribosyltransferase [Butyrivibrio sp. FCS014]|uniref:xanthine phosphoribosyltransferase n=1 Tax=Butyrivibrio sp. FCS014 TaxID=1408304 RepID=UPI00046354F0|nr:xanthine phosphoribosyltransferase [Butyrivibrio sp. FCS014]